MPFDSLFTPTKVGSLELKNRVVMAPLTRMRATPFPGLVPVDMFVEYYGQRASEGGLLITEATYVAEEAGGFPTAPGLYTPAQIAGWKKVTDAVHAKGGYIYVQLWALGYANKGACAGVKVVSSSNELDASGSSGGAGGDGGSDIRPEPLSEEDIQRYIQHWATASKAAVEEAGFDGVEIHGAHGYLIDQFTQSIPNTRTDKWGGSIENRTRFALEVIDAVAAAIGPEKTAIRLSPYSTFQVMKKFDDRRPDHLETFDYLTKQIVARQPNLSYLHFVEARGDPNTLKGWSLPEGEDPAIGGLDRFREIVKESNITFMAAGGFTGERADEVVKEKGGIIAFGRQFISNPDLPKRLQLGSELNSYNRHTFYTQGPEGYIDYPTLQPVIA